jgi:hypothetical protein
VCGKVTILTTKSTPAACCTTPLKLMNVRAEGGSRCGWLTHVKAQHLLLTLLHCQPVPSFVLQPCFLSLTHYSDMETIFKCTDPSHCASYRSEHFSQYSRKQNWRTHHHIWRFNHCNRTEIQVQFWFHKINRLDIFLLGLGLQICLALSGFPTKFLYAFIICHMRATCPTLMWSY